jgi:hypothetical protein
MILNELYDPPVSDYQDVEDDNSKITVDDLRKTKLTLGQINKLRRMNDVRNFEFAEKLKKVQRQYSSPVEAAEPF